MKLYKYGGLFSVLTLVVVAVVFAQWRNGQRKIARVEVSFAENRHDFLDIETVNKLLILNQELSTIGVKDTLALSSIEARTWFL